MTQMPRRRQELLEELDQAERWGHRGEAHIRRALRYVRWFARGDLVTLDRLHQGVALPGELVKRAAPLLASRLSEISAIRTPYAFEKRLTKSAWAALFKMVANEATSLEYLRTRQWHIEIAPAALAAFLESVAIDTVGQSDDRLQGLFESLTKAFPERANPKYDWTAVSVILPHLIEAATTTRQETLPQWRRWLARWLKPHTYPEAFPEALEAFGDLAVLVLEAKDWDQVLQDYSINDLHNLNAWHPLLYRRASELCPQLVAAILARLWDSRSFDKEEWKWAGDQYLLASCLPVASHALTILAVPLGMTVGCELAKYDWELEQEAGTRILANLHLPTPDALPPEVVFQIRLWSSLQRLARYESSSWKHETERRGLQSSIDEMAAGNPADWASALPWLLECSHHLGGLVEAITVSLAPDAAEVAVQLEKLTRAEVSVVRDRAKGLQDDLHGVTAPKSRFDQALLSLVARRVDGSPVHPHPLDAPSSTWIGALDLESFLRSSASEAESRFRSYFATQGGIEEEAVTGRLLTELELAWSRVRDRLLPLRGKRRLPSLELRHRQVPKKEEHDLGCDIAFLVRVTDGWSSGIEVAEFVQVKKPVRENRGDKGFQDQWRISRSQLDDLLALSPNSVYWLLGVQGEVLAVPAKVLKALSPKGGKRLFAKPSATFQLPYFKVRSASISLPQFLVDLVIGLWLGTNHPEAVGVAKGSSATTTPRHLVEILVSLEGEHQG